MTFIRYILVLLFLLFALVGDVYAATEAGGSANFNHPVIINDPRVIRLKGYLQTKNPQLAGSAAHFVAEADRLDIDWRLVAAISGLESSFCLHIPARSYNCWGWGIPKADTVNIGFSGFNDGITRVSEGLRYKYIDRGLESIEEIGRVYAASPTWSSRVRFFMADITKWEPNDITLKTDLTF